MKSIWFNINLIITPNGPKESFKICFMAKHFNLKTLHMQMSADITKPELMPLVQNTAQMSLLETILFYSSTELLSRELSHKTPPIAWRVLIQAELRICLTLLSS